MARPDRARTFLEMARILAGRSTCGRRKVGCILLDSCGHIIGSGYNGTGAGLPHCIENPCPGIDYDSGQGLDKCEAIHAEQNALLQCNNVMNIEVAVVTTSPCMHCAKLFLNTSCKILYYGVVYDQKVLDFMINQGVSCVKVS